MCSLLKVFGLLKKCEIFFFEKEIFKKNIFFTIFVFQIKSKKKKKLIFFQLKKIILGYLSETKGPNVKTFQFKREREREIDFPSTFFFRPSTPFNKWSGVT